MGFGLFVVGWHSFTCFVLCLISDRELGLGVYSLLVCFYFLMFICF